MLRETTPMFVKRPAKITSTRIDEHILLIFRYVEKKNKSNMNAKYDDLTSVRMIYRGLACFKGTLSPDYEKLAKYWEQKLEDGERPAVIDELCIDLATNGYACRQDHTKGWYNPTNMLAKKQKYLDTPISSSDPPLLEDR